MRAVLALLAVLGVLAAAGCGGSPAAAPADGQGSRFAGQEIGQPEPAADFALRDQDGRLVRLSALRGKDVLLTFLYTHCPDTCPLIATNLDTVLRRLGPERADVRALAVSVDPKGDTHAAVRRFVAEHRLLPQFRYLRGTRAQLAPVWKAYGVLARKGPEQTIDHSAYTMLIDRAGVGRVVYDAQVRPGQVLHDLRALGKS